ncbi:MAG: RNA polymerase sigma factor [Verrucomicrobia bacterium]|nr:RNA polymerase sigma factor [Verrucomicrobiota bacterium]MDA1067794.1 RNA polymerase sigma factor [Verrucomicrobiota bacterium]
MDSQTDKTNDLNFQDLVSNYYQPLYRFAYSLARNAEEASDLTQQTFLIWAKKGSSLKDKTKVKSWLFTTLYREFLGLRRKSSRFPHINAEAIEHELPSISPNVVSSMDSKSALEALAEIDEAFRAPLVLFYMKDLTYKEIAEILEIPIGTVMSRLSRGKAQLKKILNNTHSNILRS